MRRKAYIVLTVCIVCFALFCVFFLQKNISDRSNTELISKASSVKIDEKPIICNQAKVYPNYGIVPMFSVLEEFGISTRWLENGDVVISYEGCFATLKLTSMELIDEQHGYDLFLPLPGCSYYYCELIENEIYLDDLTMHNILYQFGIKTEIIVDYENSQILIKKRVI